MRILKGQEILPDDSTLVQHNISDDDIVNVLIEPEKDIEIELQCGPKTYKHIVSHTTTVKGLKTLLIERKETAFFYAHFNLVMQKTNNDIKQDEVLDDSLPLHYYTSNLSVKLQALSRIVQLKSQNPFGQAGYHKITYKTTVNDLKKLIMKTRCSHDVTDISMFVSDGNDGYTRLDESDTVPAHKLLPENKTVYFIVEKQLFSRCWSMYYEEKEIGHIYCANDENFSRYETILAVKLRIQEGMGIPASCVYVYSVRRNQGHRFENLPRLDKHLRADYSSMDSDCYIEIKYN